MTAVSYPRAAAGCFPFFGPAVAALSISHEMENFNDSQSSLSNARVYAICGAIGSVTSIATMVALIALGFFSVIPGGIIIGSFVFAACMYLNQANKINPIQ